MNDDRPEADAAGKPAGRGVFAALFAARRRSALDAYRVSCVGGRYGPGCDSPDADGDPRRHDASGGASAEQDGGGKRSAPMAETQNLTGPHRD